MRFSLALAADALRKTFAIAGALSYTVGVVVAAGHEVRNKVSASAHIGSEDARVSDEWRTFGDVVRQSPAPKRDRETPNIRAIVRLDALMGVLLVDQTLLRATPAGEHVTDITPPLAASGTIDGVFFLDRTSGWAMLGVANGSSHELRIAHTDDSGATWTQNPFSPISDEILNDYAGSASLSFVDSRHGWAMLRLQSSSNFSLGVMFKTDDGGKSWTPLPRPPIGDPILFMNPKVGWVAGGSDGAQLFVTHDSGMTWDSVELPEPPLGSTLRRREVDLPSVIDRRTAVVSTRYGDEFSADEVRYKSGDGAETWSIDSIEAMPDMRRVSDTIADGSIVRAVGREKTVAVTAAGVTREASSPVTSPVHLMSVKFVNRLTGWLLTRTGECRQAMIQGCRNATYLFTTDDGGSTITDLTTALSLQSSAVLAKRDSVASTAVEPVRAEFTTTVQNKEGFDKCEIPTVPQMQTWKTSSPYSAIGVYIGGSHRTCANSGLTSTWVSSVETQGWGLIPIWAGPQAPGKFTSSLISTVLATALQQGKDEASAASDRAASLGFSAPAVVYYDLEAYDRSNLTYRAGVQAFINGWVIGMHNRGNVAGVYSSHPEFQDWTAAGVANVPDAIWFAWFFQNGVSCGTACHTVYGVSDISDSLWTGDHRIRQTSSTFDRCWSSVCFTGTSGIDEDWLDGPVITGGAAQTATLSVYATVDGTPTSNVSMSLAPSDKNGVSQLVTPSTLTNLATYNLNQSVTITTPLTLAGGAQFVRWDYACQPASANRCTVTMDTNRGVTALYQFATCLAGFPGGGSVQATACTSPTLTVNKVGTGTGNVTSNPSGINCGSACQFAFTTNSQVTLTENAGSGSVFGGWSGACAGAGTSTQCTVTMSQALTATATFTAQGSTCTDSYEPNNGSLQAYGPITAGASYQGKICDTTDVDWFDADWTVGQPVNLNLSIPSNADYDLELYSPSGLWITGSYNKGIGQAEAIAYTPSVTGRYLIRIYGYLGSFNTSSSYALSFSSSSAQPCTYSINSTLATGSGGGGSGSVQVTGTPNGCSGSWSATPSSNGGWLTLSDTTSQSGSGSWLVGYSYSANSSTSLSRTGSISFSGSFPGGSTFTLIQNPAAVGGCSYSIVPTFAGGQASGGSGSVQVTGSPSGCTGSWSAVPSSAGNWLTLTGQTTGNSGGTVPVSYSFTANPSTSSTRSGSISFSGSFGSTFTLTQDAATVSGGGDLIVDGGFESATASGNVAPGWGVSPSPGSGLALIIQNGPYPHTGANYASLGGQNSTQYDWLLQTVTIPSNATAPTLTAWINVTTLQAPGAGVADVLWVAIYDTNGNPISTLQQVSNLDAALSNNTTGNYFQIGPFDLSAFKGMSVQVAFVAYTDSSLPTLFLIDDVSLQTSAVDNPPTSSIVAPSNGATVSGTVNVAASASDDVGVTSLEIDIDGVAKASNTNSSSLSYSWNTTLFSNGQHQIYSKASDGAGHVTTSSIVTLTVSNVVLAAPSFVSATAASPFGGIVVFGQVTGAVSYQIFRSSNNSGYAFVGTSIASGFPDNGLSPNTTYLYRVRGVDSANNVGPLSNPDIATTVMFTDDPVVAGSTTIKAIHLAELRTAVNAVRAAAGMSQVTFTGSVTPGVVVGRTQIVELRSYLDAARAQLGLSALSYTDTTLTSGTTPIKAAHINELRAGVK